MGRCHGELRVPARHNFARRVGTDQFNDLVDAIGRVVLLFARRRKSGIAISTLIRLGMPRQRVRLAVAFVFEQKQDSGGPPSGDTFAFQPLGTLTWNLLPAS